MKRNCLGLLAVAVLVFGGVVFGVTIESKTTGAASVPKAEPNRAGPSGERVNQMLSHIRSSDPNEAARLEKLQKEDPEKFQVELRQAMRAAFMREVPQSMRQRESNAAMSTAGKTVKLSGATGQLGMMEKAGDQHLNWLKENYPAEADKLNSLKDKDPNTYREQMRLSFNKYRNIERASRDNPQLADALKEEMKVDEQIKKVVGEIKATSDDKQKQKQMEELKGLAGQKVDIDLKKRQAEHQMMVKRLGKMQEQVKANEAELKKQESPEIRSGKIDAMMKDLTGSALK